MMDQQESVEMQQSKDITAPVVLLEVIFTFGKIVTVVAGILVVVLSVVAGCSWFDIALRGSLTMLVLGLLMWLINLVFVRGLIENATVVLETTEDVNVNSNEWTV